ncbi:hypothetical protein [Streptomyces sp. P9-A2]|uniref:hypothetical protein n=1 Tax=Streptomyces sp. P9-A2 TaxID=3072284 RepID=UPI002FC5F98B
MRRSISSLTVQPSRRRCPTARQWSPGMASLREFVDVLLGRYDVVQEPVAVERLPLSDLLRHYVQ